MLFSDLSLDSISGEGSFRVASRLYCVAEWGCHRPWESEGGGGMCAGLCASSLVHAEKFFLRDWDQDAEHCGHCRRCCSEQFEVWPLGALGVEAGPVMADLKSCRENVVWRGKAVKDTRERWFGAGTVTSSAVGETTPRTTVRISDVVEVGDVHYAEEHNRLGLPCCSR